MLDFAMRVSQESASVAQAHIDAVLAEGFTLDDVWDIGAVAAFFALSNRMANMTAMRPNDEFYTLGR